MTLYRGQHHCRFVPEPISITPEITPLTAKNINGHFTLEIG